MEIYLYKCFVFSLPQCSSILFGFFSRKFYVIPIYYQLDRPNTSSGIAASEAINQELEQMETMDTTMGLFGVGSGGGEDANSIGEGEDVTEQDP